MYIFRNWAIASLVIALVLGGTGIRIANAQVTQSLWKVLGGVLSPVVATWDIQDTNQAAASGTNCLQITTTGLIQKTGSACGSGGGTFPFTPNTWGNSTSTTIGFTQGIIANASSTFAYLNTIGNAYTDATGKLLTQATTSSSQVFQGVWRDGNQNAFAQNFVSAATSFPTNGGTVTLTVASPRTWIFNGSSAQTMKLPNATTLTTGTTFSANNNASGVVTVVDNGSNTLALVPPGGSALFVASSTATANGVWDAHAYLGHGNVSGTGTLGVGTSTPGADLSVNGAWNDTNALFLVGTTTSTASTTVFSIDKNGLVSANNATTSQLTVSGNTYLNTGTSGYVLISSTTPNSTDSSKFQVTSTSAGGDDLALFESSSNLSFVNNHFMNDLGIVADFGIGGSGLATPFANNAYIQSGATGDISLLTNSGSIVFYPSTIEAARITGNGIVGIGTTSPWATLSVSTTSQSLAKLPLFDVGSTTGADLFNVLGNGNVGIGSTSPGSLLSIGSLGWNFYNNATSTKFGVGGTNINDGCYAFKGTCLATGGTVSSITTSNGINGGTITTTGNLSLANWLATSTSETGGQLAVWGTTSGTPAKLYSVATSTPSIGTVISYSGTLGNFIGGSSGTFSIANNAVTVGMLAQAAANTVLGNPTGATANVQAYATSSLFSGSLGQFAVFRGTGLLTGTSTSIIGMSNAGLIGIGTSTPWATLSISTTTQTVAREPLFDIASTTNLDLFNVLGNGFVGVGSSSPSNTFSVNGLGSGFYISSTGKVVAQDTTNSWYGRISPTHTFSLSEATTTATWAAGTSTGAWVPQIVMPYSGVIKQTYCNATGTTPFYGVSTYINSTRVTPGYLVASTTVGIVPLTANNSFTRGQIVSMYVGTSTAFVGISVTCNYDVIESP